MSKTTADAQTDDSGGVFSALIGHSGAKAILRSGLRRGDVHLLLSGPPASGKSVALLAIEDAVEGAEYVDARGFTERKLRDTLAEDPPALLIDEFDNMKTDAFKALNTALEQGRVTKQATGDSYDVDISTQVFVACNYPDRLPGDVTDRFVSVEFDPYTREEYIDVCEVLLPEQVEWLQETPQAGENARRIARIVWESSDSRSPRTARDAARLAAAPDRVRDIIRAMEDAKADVDSDPVAADELPHNNRESDDEVDSIATGTRPKSLDEIRQRKQMVDPDDIKSRSPDEIQDLLDSTDDDSDDDDDGSDDDTIATSTDTDSEESEGGDAQDAAEMQLQANQGSQQSSPDDVPGDTPTETARIYIEGMIDENNRVIPNNFEMIGVSIIVPDDIQEEVYELIQQYDLAPGEAGVFPQSPTALEDRGLEEAITEGMTSFQFVMDDPENVKSSGYDLVTIAEALEDEPAMVSKSTNIPWEPFE